MKIKDIKKPGFFVKPDDERRIFIYEVFKNSDEKWLEEEPEAIWLVDRWLYDQTDHDDRKHYGVDGCIFTNAHENSDTEIEVVKNSKLKKLVKECLKAAPSYFYTMPACTTGKYHPFYCLGEGLKAPSPS